MVTSKKAQVPSFYNPYKSFGINFPYNVFVNNVYIRIYYTTTDISVIWLNLYYQLDLYVITKWCYH